MAITIRERSHKRTTRLSPQVLDVDVSAVGGGVERESVSLGFNTEVASHFFRFTLPRRVEIRVQRISDDPYAAHVAASVGLEEARVSQPLWNTSEGDSGWLPLEAGTYRLVVGTVLPSEQKLEMLFLARPRRIEALGLVPIDSTANCVGLLASFAVTPMTDARTVERYRDLNLAIDIDTELLPFDFSFWSAVLEVYTSDFSELLHSQPLDSDLLASGVFAVVVDADVTALWPDPVAVKIIGSSTNDALLLSGEWLVVDADGGPSFIEGGPIEDVQTVYRNDPFAYALQMPLVPEDPTGWRVFLDWWTEDYGARLLEVEGDLSLLSGVQTAVFAVDPTLTAYLPNSLRARVWLVDPDDGTHFVARGLWPVLNGTGPLPFLVVRDDRIIQAGEDIAYRVRLLLDATPLDLVGASGALFLRDLDGTPLPQPALNVPFVLDESELADGIVSTLIPANVTALLNAMGGEQIAMGVLANLPDGRVGVPLVVGVWTVSQGYSEP
jgi:hypothetical protein